jgi:predicted Zn-dependent protease with MMP-like domain
MKPLHAPTSTRQILAAAVVALVSGVGVLTLLAGFSSSPALKTLQMGSVILLGSALLTSVIVLSLVHFAAWHSPVSEDDFELVVRRAERLASQGSWGAPDSEAFGGTDDFVYEDFGTEMEPHIWNPVDEQRFRAIVRTAIDELPLEFHRALEHVAIVIADGGASVRTGSGLRGAYGLYQGDTVVQDYFHDRIVIFRDTLVRDFGHDPDLLRERVTRTVRHELAHHLGWNERGVSDLGL